MKLTPGTTNSPHIGSSREVRERLPSSLYPPPTHTPMFLLLFCPSLSLSLSHFTLSLSILLSYHVFTTSIFLLLFYLSILLLTKFLSLLFLLFFFLLVYSLYFSLSISHSSSLKLYLSHSFYFVFFGGRVVTVSVIVKRKPSCLLLRLVLTANNGRYLTWCQFIDISTIVK